MANTKQKQRQSESRIQRTAFGRIRQVGSFPWNSEGIKKKNNVHPTSNWKSSLGNNYLSSIINPITHIFDLGTFSQRYVTPFPNDTNDSDSNEDEMVHNVEMCFGTLRTDIVGIHDYDGKVKDREMVTLLREPYNILDHNAICVNNVDGIKVGYITKELAKPLADICDSLLTRIEGDVPCGSSNLYCIPVDLTLWGMPQNHHAVVDTLKQYGYFLINGGSPSFQHVPSTSQAEGLSHTWHNPRWTYLTQAEVKNDLYKLFEKIKEEDKSSTTEPAEAIGSKLYPHQKQALNWMIKRENGSSLPPFWEERGGTYFNSITNFIYTERPKGVHGGILADDMGLGKTLEMIALILTNFENNMPLAVRVPGTIRDSCKTKLIQVPKKDAMKVSNRMTSSVCATAGRMSDIQLHGNTCPSKVDRPSQDYPLKSKDLQSSSNVISNLSKIRMESKPLDILWKDVTSQEIDVIEISSGESDSEETYDSPKPLTGMCKNDSEDELPDLPPVTHDGSVIEAYHDFSSQFNGICERDFEDELPYFPSIRNDGSLKGNGKCGTSLGRTMSNGPRTTLIVCPLSVISNWQNQLEEHVHESVHLDIYLYYGTGRIRDNAILAEKDIVLTTYHTLSADYRKGNSPLEKVQWLRIVLDEAHAIRNPDAQMTKAILALNAQRKWALTGTPIQNYMKDLWSLINFLQISPFTHLHWWHRTIEKPLEQGDERAFKRVQHLVSHIALRRTKTQKVNDKPLVELPERKVYLEYITLSREERDAYDVKQNEGKLTVNAYLEEGTLLENYGEILVILLRLRQLCCHPILVGKATRSNKATIDSCQSSEGLQEKLIDALDNVMRSDSDEECAICLESLKSPVITNCAHIFCKPCIKDVIKKEKTAPKCPLCRSAIDIKKLWEMPPEDIEVDCRQQIETGEWVSSSKVDALMNALLQLRCADPTVKSIVVSQFTSFLKILEVPLCANGFRFVRLVGSMNTKARTRAMNDFSDNSPGSPTIILLSLKAGGVGINLTAASRVFLLDPAWNPASEEQCFDRCHRLGQTKEVTITKFIVEDSIETKMLELQEKKRQLMQRSFGQKESKDEKRQARINDIKSLMDL